MSDCNCNEGGICHPCYDAKCEKVKQIKALLKRYIENVLDNEGIHYFDCMSEEDQKKLNVIWKLQASEKGD